VKASAGTENFMRLPRDKRKNEEMAMAMAMATGERGKRRKGIASAQ